ncbi:hypothetical protein GCM10017778_60830 [Streptomyces vinaceus]|nr:hypothetical protein GCM10017778_60830 [Streptomyces vinaceus]
MTYWDPMPTLRACAEGEPLPGLAQWVPAYNATWGARPHAWSERNWRNVPGPFYGAATDTCWAGRGVAPDHVLYDDEYGQEFVYRRPRTPEETHRVMAAAWQDPMAGFECDGDAHWTPELVRDWWRDRGRPCPGCEGGSATRRGRSRRRLRGRAGSTCGRPRGCRSPRRPGSC